MAVKTGGTARLPTRATTKNMRFDIDICVSFDEGQTIFHRALPRASNRTNQPAVDRQPLQFPPGNDKSSSKFLSLRVFAPECSNSAQAARGRRIISIL